MSDTRLVSPDQVEDMLVDLLTRRHPEHLAALERRRGLAPETLERFNRITHDSAYDGARSGDGAPIALIGWAGTAQEPAQNEHDALDVPLSIGVTVIVRGRNRRDTCRRRDQLAWTVIECILQRAPRGGLIRDVVLSSVEPIATGDATRTLGECRILFTLTVDEMVSLAGPPEDDDESWPDGTPGGAPSEPYDPPVPLPPASDVSTEVTREPIA